MRTKFKLLIFTAAIAVAGLMTWEAFVPSRAQAQTPAGVGSPSWSVFSGVPLTVISNSTTNFTSTAVRLRNNQGIAILPFFAGTNTGTANQTFTFHLSPDGTNYTTLDPYSIVIPMNGTAGVIGYTNWPPSVLNNVQYIKLVSIQTAHTANIQVTNVFYSFLTP